MTTNKELVRRLAEEMAHKAYDEAVKNGSIDVKDAWSNFKYSAKWTHTHIPFAEIAVKFGAKMFERGYEVCNTEPIWGESQLLPEMEAAGLISEQLPGAGEEIEREGEREQLYYPGKSYQKLFDHMNDQHGVIMVESEIQEVINIVRMIESGKEVGDE